MVQAIRDYLPQAVEVFRKEQDLPQDIAEDVTREAVESMGVSGFHERLYGTVDYKKAIYVFVPQAEPVALMLDAKAEKTNGAAVIQMSQTSMLIKYQGSRGPVNEEGKLAKVIERGDKQLRVVSIIAKYIYRDRHELGYDLEKIIVACIPNGALQDRYNPTLDDTIWRAGKHSWQRGEDFRVRLNYKLLAAKASWRVRHIQIE